MKRLIFPLICLISIVSDAQVIKSNFSSFDSAWKFVGVPGFSPKGLYQTSLAFSPSGEPYVFFDQPAGDVGQVMKFNGTNWESVCCYGSSLLTAWSPTIVFSPSGFPYLAFSNAMHDGRANVLTFDGTYWVPVGTQYFTESGIWYTSMAFSLNGIPYLAFRDSFHAGKAAVVKLTGNFWENVGVMGFSAGQAEYTSLAFSQIDSLPYLAYKDCWNSKKATVMKFDGSPYWKNVGMVGFSAGEADYTSLAFSPADHQPYVAFSDWGNAIKATVMKFNGTNWENVGMAGFSAGEAKYTSLAFSPLDHMPYVAFSDGANSFKTTVMKFNGTLWVNVGNAGFSPHKADGLSFAFSQTGLPTLSFVEYEDTSKITVMQFDSVYIGGYKVNAEIGIDIYPNPASNKLTLELISIPYKMKFIEIYDVLGLKIFANQTSEDKFSINIERFPAGTYIVRLMFNNTYYYKKFCKI